MLTNGSLSVICDELKGVDRVVAFLAGLIHSDLIGIVDIDDCVGRLEYIVSLGYPMEHAGDAAASLGSLEELKYFHDKGYPITNWAFVYCTILDSVECMQFLYFHGYIWNRYTCMYAAKADAIHCLIFAIEHGCPFDRDQCLVLAGKRCLAYLS